MRLQNEEFNSSTDEMGGILSGLMKNTTTHSSLDNNDKCQDTNTGKNTTHHTNFLLFQPNPPTNGVSITTATTSRTTSSIENNLNYKIGKLVPPSALPEYKI